MTTQSVRTQPKWLELTVLGIVGIAALLAAATGGIVPGVCCTIW